MFTSSKEKKRREIFDEARRQLEEGTKDHSQRRGWQQDAVTAPPHLPGGAPGAPSTAGTSDQIMSTNVQQHTGAGPASGQTGVVPGEQVAAQSAHHAAFSRMMLQNEEVLNKTQLSGQPQFKGTSSFERSYGCAGAGGVVSSKQAQSASVL